MYIENRLAVEYRSQAEMGKEVQQRAAIIKKINETLKKHK